MRVHEAEGLTTEKVIIDGDTLIIQFKGRKNIVIFIDPVAATYGVTVNGKRVA